MLRFFVKCQRDECYKPNAQHNLMHLYGMSSHYVFLFKISAVTPTHCVVPIEASINEQNQTTYTPVSFYVVYRAFDLPMNGCSKHKSNAGFLAQ